jgi:cytochrome c
MSKFPNQLALVSVSVLALTAGAIWQYERAAYKAEAAAEAAAEEARLAAAREAAQAALDEAAEEVAETAQDAAEEVVETAEEVAEEVADEVAVETAEAEPGAESAPAETEAEVAEAGADAHGHGEPGTAPLASVIAGAAVAQTVDSPAMDATGVSYGLGRAALPEEVEAWDIDIRPDGAGLPEGSGDVWTGEEVFIENCAVCHGDFAEGLDRWPSLAGGLGSLTHDRPEKTVGSYWPYLSTVFDYVYRAMPYGYAQSLEPDQVYAITAYLLYSNGIVEDDFELSKENFTEVRLPNEENFFMDDRAEGEIPAFSREVCMENCKEDVEITMRAVVLDVTPETEGSATEPAEIAPMGEGEDAAAAAPDEGQGTEMAAADAGAVEEAEAVEVAAAAPDPELVAQGEAAFRQCQACHQVGEDASHRVGPVLNDLFGRTAGSIEDFRYSNVMMEAGEEGLVWTPETLHDFLADPRGYLRGTKMSFAGYRDDADIAAVTAYLQTFSQ